MIEAVLDASALLRNEPGAERVEAVRSRACISSINVAEICGRLVDSGKSVEATLSRS